MSQHLLSVAVLLVFLLIFSGCSVKNLHEVYSPARAPVPGEHPLDAAGECDEINWLPYRSCGFHFFECPCNGPWSNDSLQVVEATKNYKYAMMANNSYRYDSDTIFYVIPGWSQVSRMESDSGLSVDVYERREGVEVVELAVVYEGTNFGSSNDWKFNLSLLKPNQFTEALEHVERLKGQYPDVSITAVGHSLGGGLALNVSMLVDGVNAVAFNSSPRAFWGNEDQSNGNRRVHIYEVGEILSPFSRTYLRARLSGSQMTPVKYNFLDYRGVKPVSEHSMYYISRGLILVAIKGGERDAARTFVANIGKMHEDCKYCREIISRSQGQ